MLSALAAQLLCTLYFCSLDLDVDPLMLSTPSSPIRRDRRIVSTSDSQHPFFWPDFDTEQMGGGLADQLYFTVHTNITKQPRARPLRWIWSCMNAVPELKS
jgi:hypothetical protein